MGKDAVNSSRRGHPTKEMELAWPPTGSSFGHQALTWNPQGQRKRERETWQWELEKDIKRTGHTSGA